MCNWFEADDIKNKLILYFTSINSYSIKLVMLQEHLASRVTRILLVEWLITITFIFFFSLSRSTVGRRALQAGAIVFLHNHLPKQKNIL